MADFDKYVPILSNVEGYGKFTNNPKDPGKETMSGVTLATYRAYYGAYKTVEDLKKMTYEQWHHIMKTGYWDKVGGDKISNQSVANIWADWAVNSGPKTAVRAIQELVGENPDGAVGPLTLGAVNRAPQELLFNAIKASRESFYYARAWKDNDARTFLKGWLNRLKQFTFNR